MIDSTIYTPNSYGHSWRAGESAGTRGVGNRAHVEVELFGRAFGRNTQNQVVLFQQDGFPCIDSCDAFFTNQSKRNNLIIFKVTADNGFYGCGHFGGKAKKVETPRTIYYFNGVKTIVPPGIEPLNLPQHPPLPR